MAIQNSINQGLGTIAAAATMAKHMSNQNKENEAQIAQSEEAIVTNEEALKSDQFEAQQAILAHAGTEGLNEAQIKKLREDPSYAQELRETKLKETRQERLEDASLAYNRASENQLAKDKNGKLMLDSQGNPMTEKDAANVQLNKAYESLRELNDRIAVTRQFKFNIDKAKANIRARGGKI